MKVNPAESPHIFFQKQPNPQLKNSTLKGGKLKLAEIIRIQHLKASKLKEPRTDRYAAEDETQEQEEQSQMNRLNKQHVASKFFPQRSWRYIDALYRGHSLVIRANKKCHETQLQGNYFSRNLEGRMNQYLNVVMESRGGGQLRIKQKKVYPSEEKIAVKKQNYFCRQMKRTFLLRKKNQHSQSPFKGGNLVLDNLKTGYFPHGSRDTHPHSGRDVHLHFDSQYVRPQYANGSVMQRAVGE